MSETPQTALVVDDSKALRHTLRIMLERHDFTVLEAANGEEALRVLKSFGLPTLLLVDWQMPVMDGLSLVRAVRERDKAAALRILMVTAVSNLDALREALAAGVNEYLMKPYTYEALADKLAILGFVHRTPAHR